MENNRSVSPTIRNHIISQIVPITSTNTPLDNSQNVSYLLIQMQDKRTSEHSLPLITVIPRDSISSTDTNQQQQTVLSTPMDELQKIAQFHLNLLKYNENKRYIDQSYKKFHQRQRRFSNLKNKENQQFNKVSYCIAYCTIIIIGVTIGGWIGGLFEFISNGYNGCTNEYRGTLKCQIKYGSFNVTTRCINIFYKKSIPNKFSPYICLCRFRNNVKSKYRDCEFLHAKIQ